MKHKLFLTLLIAIAFIGKATIITVTNTNDSGPGSLREALANTIEGDEVRFDPSLIAGGNATIVLTSEILVMVPITITGLYNANDTLYISGGNTNRMFNVNVGFSATRTLVLDSLVLVNGNMNGDTGGAILITDTDSLIISNSKFSYNTADFGGAIGYGFTTNPLIVVVLENSELSNNSAFMSGGGLLANNNSGMPGQTYVYLNNCLVLYNTSYYGGGIFCDSDFNGGQNIATVSVDNSMFIGNTAAQGAAIHCGTTIGETFSNVLINNSTFSDNACTEYGGVMRVVSIGGSTTVIASYSTFSNNTAGLDGGAIYCDSYAMMPDTSGNTEVKLTNCTMFGNTANRNGAAIHAWSSDSSWVGIYNSTIVNNNASTLGGGIYMESDEYSEIKIKGSIIAANNGGNISSQPTVAITSLGYNIFSDASVNGSISSDQLGATAGQLQLGPLQLNGGTTPTLEPASGSIAINNGDPLDMSAAQNGVICGTREVGAAENCSASIGLTNNRANSKTLIVSPNPASDEVVVNFEGDMATLKITDVMGKLIEEKTSYSDEKIDLRNYSNGIYFFIVETNKVRSIYKVVKQ